MTGAPLSARAELDALHGAIRACRACERAGLLACARPVAGSQGPAPAQVMIIGQAPGRLTVERQLMFGGPSGATLERWLTQAGFAPGALRRDVYLTALTRCDPGRSAKGRGDRKPSPTEVALCRHWLDRELALVRPRVILLVGGMAIEAWLGPCKLDDIVGEIFERDGVALFPLPHPSGVSRWLNDPARQALVARALARLSALRAGWAGAAPEWPDSLRHVVGITEETTVSDEPETAAAPVAEKAPKRVLIVMAHPDDGEFGCGGAVARWAAEGRDIWYCLVTDGQVGDAGDTEITSEQLVAKRQKEAQAAADTLGVQHPVIFLHYMDSQLEPTMAVRRDIARVIRQVKPDVVICQDPTVRWSGQGYINHPDHRAAGEATLAAIMPVASTRLAFPELAAEGLGPHNVREVYITGTQNADRWVDIEGYVETKIAALRQHVSQIPGWDPAEAMTQWAKESGAMARKMGHDMTYAEGFKYIRLEDD